MVFYGITLVPLAEELRAADPGFLSPFYEDDAASDSLERQSSQLLKLLIERGLYRGYLPKPAKSLFISDTLDQEEGTRREFVAEGLMLKFVSGSKYLRAYLGPHKDLAAWVKHQVEAWYHGVRVLCK